MFQLQLHLRIAFGRQSIISIPYPASLCCPHRPQKWGQQHRCQASSVGWGGAAQSCQFIGYSVCTARDGHWARGYWGAREAGRGMSERMAEGDLVFKRLGSSLHATSWEGSAHFFSCLFWHLHLVQPNICPQLCSSWISLDPISHH